MPESKTKPKIADVQDLLQSLEDPQQRDDALRLLDLMRQITGIEPELWSGSIVGFGRHQVVGASRTVEWFHVGFAPRNGILSIYIPSGFEAHAELMARLGNPKTGKGCLYVKRLADIDLEVLEALIRAAWKRATTE